MERGKLVVHRMERDVGDLRQVWWAVFHPDNRGGIREVHQSAGLAVADLLQVVEYRSLFDIFVHLVTHAHRDRGATRSLMACPVTFAVLVGDTVAFPLVRSLLAMVPPARPILGSP